MSVNNQDFKEFYNPEYWKKIFKNFLESKIEESKNIFYSLDPEIEKKIPKIRSQIFEDKDFLELSKKIISYKPKGISNQTETQIKRVYKFNDFFSNHLFSKLNTVYVQDEIEGIINFLFSKSYSDFIKKLENYLQNIELGFPSYCLLISNEYTTSYIPYYCYRLDEETQKNFFINFNDEVIPLDLKETDLDSFELIYITNVLKDNIFFKKRVSKNVLDRTKVILFSYQKIGSLDFLHSVFFDSESNLNYFLGKKRYIKLKTFLKEVYLLFLREANILFENKQKIITRMVFSYSYYQVKKLISLYGNLISIRIYFTEIPSEEELTKSMNIFKEFFINYKNLILIRNHFSIISIFLRKSEELIKDIKILIQELENKIPLSFEYKIQEYSIQNWSFFDI